MNDTTSYRHVPTVLADLGPLPEVVESNSDSTWKMFLSLQSTQGQTFLHTEPSGVMPFWSEESQGDATLTVQDVMVEARRSNRVCPNPPQWQRFHALLKEATGAEAPPPLSRAEAAATPPLVKRIRVRDQVEWAAERGQLSLALGFFRSLPEDQWVHIGR